MCGIAGMVKLNPGDAAERTVVERMRDVLHHRGPDGEGLWLEGPVGLGHRRLAIVDVATGQQPMTNEDGSCWITYNGEIYNHIELRAELEARGHRYRTRSDTETVLHLYEEEGERCVERLQGMFAFALWDRAREQLLLARDRLGIKPLYYAVRGDALLFGSEIKAILAAGTIKPELDHALLPEYLATGYVAGEATLVRGVRKLLPGRTLTWSRKHGVTTRRYWQLSPREDSLTAGLAARAAILRRRLEAAVRSHLMSDVPLGVFLSGGLDSSAIAALMAPMVREPIRTFSVGFNEPEANELAYARMAARAVGAEHREVVVTPSEFFGTLPRLVWHEDEPIAFPSSVPLHFVSRLARDHVKVVLTGEGADELFLGYNRYRVTAWNARLAGGWSAMVPGAARRVVRGAVHRLPHGLRRYADRSFLALEAGPRPLFCENFAVFPTALQERLLIDPALLANRDAFGDALRAFGEGGPDLGRAMSRADLETYLVELLMKQDQMSMSASVESRVPYLDHELVEHVLATPARFKLRGMETKTVLRAAVRDLVPREILTRRKMGFPVPVGRWLRGAFWPVVEEFILGPRARSRGLLDPDAVRRLAEAHRRGEADHGQRLWLLLNLELWHRVVLEGEEPEAALAETAAGRAA
jgi:asparagine synthase (glutamine-hydrolysing)